MASSRTTSCVRTRRRFRATVILSTGGPRDMSMLCHPETLRGQLDALSLERFEELERDVHEGPYHQGPSRVIQVVARRRA